MVRKGKGVGKGRRDERLRASLTYLEQGRRREVDVGACFVLSSKRDERGKRPP